jgi:hypothetical protein
MEGGKARAMMFLEIKHCKRKPMHTSRQLEAFQSTYT